MPQIFWGKSGTDSYAVRYLSFAEAAQVSGCRVVEAADGDNLELEYNWPPSDARHALPMEGGDPPANNGASGIGWHLWGNVSWDSQQAWLGQCSLQMSPSLTGGMETDAWEYLQYANGFCQGLWFCLSDLPSGRAWEVGVKYSFMLDLRDYRGRKYLHFLMWHSDGSWVQLMPSVDGLVEPGQWYYVQGGWSASAEVLWLQLDGPGGTTYWEKAAPPDLRSGQNAAVNRQDVQCDVTAWVDGVWMDNVDRGPGATAPHRYVEGTAILSCELQKPLRVVWVDWSGTFGAKHGSLRRVWLKGPDGWVQVGGDYPTPPVEGLNVEVSGPQIVKVELEPSQDFLRSGTPVLDWLSVAAVEAGERRVSISTRAATDRLALRQARERLSADLSRTSISTRRA